MRIAVIQYPGSNCEHETARAVQSAGMEAEVFRWNKDPGELPGYDGYILPGGFSYQDRVRAGAIAAKKAIMSTMMSEAEKGKPVMGICNGAQILVETGMIPGVAWGELEMALAPNMMEGRSGFYCDWVYLKLACAPERCVFSRALGPGEVLPMPVAHAEGRFVTRKEGLLERLWADDQIVFQYSDADGNAAAEFPGNPNGSLDSIAGICNRQGNVLALMPHPERATWLRQVAEDLGGEASLMRYRGRGRLESLRGPAPGRKLFSSMVEGGK